MQKGEYLKALKYCEEELKNDLILTDIIPDLRGHRLFTQEDEEIILHEITSKAKVQKLIDIIRNRPDELYEKFRDILRTTNDDIAEMLFDGDFSRTRRVSQTEFGDVLVKGGVPERSGSYVPRKSLEKSILEYLKSDNKKPILIHGIIGGGKTSLVSHTLYTDELFPLHFLKCCWLPIGYISETNVIGKLALLLNKLDPSVNLAAHSGPEIYTEKIRQLLLDSTSLVILDDVRDAKIMKHFLFQNIYIVTSEKQNLFSEHFGESIYVPDQFTDDECQQLLQYYDIEKPLFPKIIAKSERNPFYLSTICKRMNSNPDFKRKFDHINIDSSMQPILELSIKTFDEEDKISGKSIREYLEMLAILDRNEMISLETLSILWNLDISQSLTITEKLCHNHIMTKMWTETFNCNLYGIYSIYQNYLKSQTNKLENYEDSFVNLYLQKYKSWLDINYYDPFFFIFYGKYLCNRKKFKDLENLYTDNKFHAAKLVICGIHSLQSDFERFRSNISSSKWNLFESFFMKYGHKFINLPNVKDIVFKIKKVHKMIIQLGLYEMKDSFTFEVAQKEAEISKKSVFWRWINPEPSVKIWEMSFGDYIEHIDVNQHFIIMANQSGRVHLLEFKSGKRIFDCNISHCIILVKFLDDFKFLIIDSAGKTWTYNLKSNSAFNSQISNCSDYDEEYDEDDRNCSSSVPQNNFSYLTNQFENLSLDDFDHGSFKETKKVVYNRFQAILIENTIFLLSSHETETYVAHYNLNHQLKNDFKVPFSVKKISINPSQLHHYLLREDSGEIIEIDEFGFDVSVINVPNQVIVDFSVKGNDIFYVALNNIYKHPDLLFSVDSKVHIRKVSLSKNTDLLALCLTNDTIQIWDHVKKELLYSLNDSQFSEIYFQEDTNYIVTTGQTNVAKWKIDVLQSNNDKNNNAQSFSTLHYRRNFGFYSFDSSFILVLQNFNNNLEFRLYENDIAEIKSFEEKFKVNCFHFSHRHVFIGFKENCVKIFDLIKFELVRTIELKFKVKNLFTYNINEDHSVFAVLHYSGNEITIISFDLNQFTESGKTKLQLPARISICKVIKTNSNQLMLAVSCVEKCFIYKYKDSTFLRTYSFNMNSNILDIDVSEDEKYGCMITEIGEVTILQLSDSSVKYETVLEGHILRKCKFRPKKKTSEWNLVAVINDKAVVSLLYFNDDELKINVIDEDVKTTAMQLPKFIKWSPDSDYLLVGDYDIRRFKIRNEPLKVKEKIKPLLTNLQTYFGGIRQLYMNDRFICTIDQQGFLYLLKKIELTSQYL